MSESPTPYFDGGGVTIYHGDCREILPTIERVDLVITDPPYAIGAGCGEWSATAAVAIGLHESARLVRKGGALLAFTTTSGRGIEFTQGAIGRTLSFNRSISRRSRLIRSWARVVCSSPPPAMGAASSVLKSKNGIANSPLNA